MFRRESAADGSLLQQALEACTVSTKKVASEESRQRLQYVDIASVKNETYDVEPGGALSSQVVKKELADEISVHENEACHRGFGTNSLCDGESVKLEDVHRDCSDNPCSGSKCETQFYKCKDSSKSSKHLSLGSNTETQPCDKKFECCNVKKKHPQQLCNGVKCERFLWPSDSLVHLMVREMWHIRVRCSILLCSATTKGVGLNSVLRGGDNMNTGIQFSEINPQIVHINDKTCKETDLPERKRNWYRKVAIEEKVRMLQKKRDAARQRYRQMVGEEKVKFLQKKRDAIRNKYSQMNDEEKSRILQKLRDARNDRYRQMSDEQKAKILQKKRDAARKRYRQMTGEEKVRFLQKKRDAVRNRNTQMVDKVKVRMLEKKRDAERNRYRKMGDEEKERFLQRKRTELRNRYRQKQVRKK